MIEIQGTITADEHLSAQLLHRARHRVRRWLWRVMWILVAVALVLYVLIVTVERGYAPMILLILLAPMVLLLERYVAFPRRVARIYRQQVSLRAQLTMRIDENGLQTASPIGNASQPWSHFLKWAEGPAIFVVYQSEVLFQMIPKRLLASTADVDQVRNWLTTGIGPPS